LLSAATKESPAVVEASAFMRGEERFSAL
jgi:hypothetical protein